MEQKLINKIVRRHYRLSLWIITAITLAILFYMSVAFIWDTRAVWSLIIGVLFSFASCTVYGSVWKCIAQHSFSGLTMFYLAAPALRMFVAALVILCYCLIIRERYAVFHFIFIFCAYYFALLIFDCIYFAKEEKRNKYK